MTVITYNTARPKFAKNAQNDCYNSVQKSSDVIVSRADIAPYTILIKL